MYNNDAWLFNALQEYHTEQLTEAARRSHSEIQMQASKFQVRLRENLGDGLVALGLRLKTRPQPEIQQVG